MPTTTPFQYYSDPENYGNYQFVPLYEIINRMELVAQDDDSYMKGTKRSLMLTYAKEAVRQFTMQQRLDTRYLEITLDPQTLTWPVPQDYVDYEWMAVVHTDCVTGSRRLERLDINRNMNISVGFLQDNNYEILFDNDGYPLESDGDNVFGMAYKKYQICEHGSQFNLDTSKLSQWGEFTVDTNSGRFGFSSNLGDKEIVIAYVSDGLQNDLLNSEEIKVHKHMIEAVQDKVYHSIIEYRRTVPANEKYRAKQQAKASKHRMNINMSAIDLKEMSRMMRQLTMMP